MLKKILIGLVAIILVFVVVVAMQRAEFQVVRSTTIAAPAADVFAQVNDFHNWDKWSPWLKLDPNSNKTYEPPMAGTGAVFKWSGNNDVGEGTMTITESHPNDLIRIKLDFVKPFAATNAVEFTFKPEGDQTQVTWSMSGEKNFVGKALGLFMNMDRMVGDKFDEGLAQMKSIAEGKGKASAEH